MRIRSSLKEGYHGHYVSGIALVCIKLGWLCYEFLLGHLSSCRSHVETLGLCEHLWRIPLSCFLPAYLRLLPHHLRVLWFVSASSNDKHQCVCRSRGLAGYEVPFYFHQDWVESRGKAVDACFFITNKAQSDIGVSNFKIWGEHLELNEGFLLS